MEEIINEAENGENEAEAVEEEWSPFGACLFCLAEEEHALTDLCETSETVEQVLEAAKGILGGYKEVGEFKDPISSGRKRAGAILPPEEMGTCEWAYLGRAGGGPYPIIGCTGKRATDRHHGPDKSTLNNARPGEGETNLHAICSFCHNAWHAANDPAYGDNGKEDRPADNSTWVPIVDVWYQHDPDTKAGAAELITEEMRRLNAAGIS